MARTPSATFNPLAAALFTTSAAWRRSSMRLLVHEPMNTRCTAASVIGWPALRPM